MLTRTVEVLYNNKENDKQLFEADIKHSHVHWSVFREWFEYNDVTENGGDMFVHSRKAKGIHELDKQE